MRVLILQHYPDEGAGTLASFLEARKWELETLALYDGARFPEDLTPYQAIIAMGGPMGVHDDNEYPFLRDEDRFLKRAIAEQVPLLGICLGSQLLAKALGARVYQNPTKEIGWYTVDLSTDGQIDPLFSGLSSPLQIFQWHGDAFDMPPRAVRLASSPLCANQAFRYGQFVYALLFHVELTPEMIRRWFEVFENDLANVRNHTDPNQIISDIPRYFETYQKVRQQIFTNLVNHLWEPLAEQQKVQN